MIMKNNSNICVCKSKSAFTIIELIVVLAIIAILLGISTLVASKIIRRERIASETDQLVSLLKEAQKYSMINSYYKNKQNEISKRKYGLEISSEQDNSYRISLKWIDLKDANIAPETVREYIVNKINITTSKEKNSTNVTVISVYFNDTGSTGDNQTITITDTLKEYKRNIVISQLGHINVESPK